MAAARAPADRDPAGLDVEAVGRRVEELLEVIGSAEPAARTAAEDLLRELLGLYGVALERLVGALDKVAPEVLRRLADEPLLAGLLVLHDLHPLDMRGRVEQAAAGYPGVSVAAVTGDEVRLTVPGACGPASVPADLERAVRAAAPEVARVVMDGDGHPNGLIPPSAITVRRDRG